MLLGYFLTKTPALINNNQALITNAKSLNDSALLNANSKIDSPIPESLSGLDHGVVLRVDKNGNLIIDRHIRDLFEFYLSAMGEESLDIILKRIQSQFYAQLSGDAIFQAKSLLKNYVDYRIELVTVNEGTELIDVNGLSQVALLKIQKNDIAQLRNKYFNSETYQAFFEKEDQMDEYMLSQLDIVNNPLLTKEQKQQEIEALQNTLPEEEQLLRKKVSQHSDISAQVKEMRSAGDSDEKVFQHRAQLLGESAAQNLAILDKKRDQWKNRLQHYAIERNAILASGLSDVDAKMAISDLIENNFSAREGLRVKALDSSL